MNGINTGFTLTNLAMSETASSPTSLKLIQEPCFPILHLPYEIRLMIRKRVLVFEDSVAIKLPSFPLRHQPLVRILSLSRAVHQEIVGIFYRKNTFSFSSDFIAENFLWHRNPSACQFLSSIQIHSLEPNLTQVFKALSHCTYLRNLELDAYGEIIECRSLPERYCAEEMGIMHLLQLQFLTTITVTRIRKDKRLYQYEGLCAGLEFFNRAHGILEITYVDPRTGDETDDEAF